MYIIRRALVVGGSWKWKKKWRRVLYYKHVRMLVTSYRNASYFPDFSVHNYDYDDDDDDDNNNIPIIKYMALNT